MTQRTTSEECPLYRLDYHSQEAAQGGARDCSRSFSTHSVTGALSFCVANRDDVQNPRLWKLVTNFEDKLHNTLILKKLRVNEALAKLSEDDIALLGLQELQQSLSTGASHG